MKKGTACILSTLAGVAIGAFGIGYLLLKESTMQHERVNKFKGYYNLLNQWLILKNENKSITEYFSKNNFKTIAVYGIGEMGNRLIEELENSDVEIKYAVDKNLGGVYADIDVLDLDDDLEEVDVIVVTPIFDFDNIKQELRSICDYRIVSLEEIIFYI